MKTNKKQMHQQRQVLDQKIKALKGRPHFKGSWIKAVRSSLGISARQLAGMMKVSPSGVTQLESTEKKKTASLKSIEKAARAMECELIYMIVPKTPMESFEQLLEKKSLDLAERISKGVAHSMSLEAQQVDPEVTRQQIANLAYELKSSLDIRMWPLQSKIKAKK